jgi:hypothetical protein
MPRREEQQGQGWLRVKRVLLWRLGCVLQVQGLLVIREQIARQPHQG